MNELKMNTHVIFILLFVRYTEINKEMLLTTLNLLLYVDRTQENN